MSIFVLVFIYFVFVALPLAIVAWIFFVLLRWYASYG